ncbi:uncharacterized protein LOC108136394 [Drosophila elegans]|uniref:uncharacterized protein LOC108136394 n=1 Tax=Drosophila elegans TaxID=30023 RepID=UPI0007E6E1DE|nr:uncharacterized protein LOC108136394 [Drosophila elegans]
MAAGALLLLVLFAAAMHNSNVEKTCQINTLKKAPLVVTTIGSKTLLSGYSDLIERNKSEEIDLYCGTGFLFKNDGKNQFFSDYTTETLSCQKDGSFLFKNHEGLRIDGDKKSVECINGVAALFESRTSLPNCKEHTSFVLGHDFQEMGSIKSAALCYNIAGAQLKYIAYTTYPTKSRALEMSQEGQLNKLGFDINVNASDRFFKIASQADVDAFWGKEKQLTQMFGTGPFDYASLVQDEALGVDLAGYEDMMSIVWLHNLRTGNWRHWLAALRSASESGDQFDIRLGVSGLIEMPESPDSCDLAIDLADGSVLPVPAHIWAHVQALQPTGTPEDEFVLVGHNSPFFRGGTSADFCPSMCEQVSWLRNTLFGRLHRYPINGLMLCCRVEDVAQKLDSFYGSRSGVLATATTTDK